MSASKIDKARKALKKAIGPFRSVVGIMGPLNLPDDRPLQSLLPGGWPDMGELRRLVAAAESLDALLLAERLSSPPQR